MNDFFERRGVKIEGEDITRYAWVLTEDLCGALDCGQARADLLEAFGRESGLPEESSRKIKEAVSQGRIYRDPDSAGLYIPVIYKGRPLAVLSAAMPETFELSPDRERLLSALVDSSLEKILLYKISSIDPDTGLYNEAALLAYLRGELESFKPRAKTSGLPKPIAFEEKEAYAGLTLILTEIIDFDDLTSGYGRIQAKQCVAAVAGMLSQAAPAASMAAWLIGSRLALALPHKDIKAAGDLAAAMPAPPRTLNGQDLPEIRLGFGLACYPADFTDESGTGDQVQDGDTVDHLLLKAELALRQALVSEGNRIFTFRDILRKGGRVVHVLPFNRVVVDLGRTQGARPGQLFSLSGTRAEHEIDFKGEVLLFDVSDDFAVGEIINVRNPLNRVKAGDVLSLSRSIDQDRLVGTPGSTGGKDPLLNIPDHQGFIRTLSHLVKDKDRFVILLVRVDEYDRYRETRGRLSSDEKLKGLLELLREDMPAAAVCGRFSADCLAVVCPDAEEAEAVSLAETWQEKVTGRHSQTVTIGLAVYPMARFEKSDVMANAQKALEHAAFFGPSSLVVFDSVSLNISGDNYYEVGDLDGAVSEFKKALELDPDNLNVLNSLGICFANQRLLDQALECFDRVIALDSSNLMAHFNRGFVLSMAEKPEEALEYFTRAAHIDGRNFDVLFQLGKLALDLDRLDEALDNLTRASNLENPRSIVYRYLGQALVRAGREDEAIEVLRAAARVDPGDALSLSQLGVLYLNQGTDTEVALSLARQSVELDPSNGVFRERLARAFTCMGDLAGAEVEYRQAVNMGARSREVYFNLGQVIRDQGRPEEAQEWFGRSLELDPEYRPALDAMPPKGADPEA